jgi:beta-glucosidase
MIQNTIFQYYIYKNKLLSKMVSKKVFAIIPIALTLSAGVQAQLYKNPKAPIAQRVADLLKRMTLEEKVGQMSMSSLSEASKNKIAYGEPFYKCL